MCGALFSTRILGDMNIYALQLSIFLDSNVKVSNKKKTQRTKWLRYWGNSLLADYLTESMQTAGDRELTSVCCISNVFSVASTDEELDLREQGLKVRDVGHGELHESKMKKDNMNHPASHSTEKITNTKTTINIL